MSESAFSANQGEQPQEFNFDEVIDRHNTKCVKYDSAEKHGYSPEATPLWIADMDFRVAPCIENALHERVAHGIFGYTEADKGFYDAVCAWWRSRYNWNIEPEWCTTTPGVVYALACSVRAFTEPGDAVLIQPPVYGPFSAVIARNKRQIVEAPLTYDREAGHYSIDFEAFEQVIEREQPKIFLLCNPHNPGGRVWTAEELRTMGEICMAHNMLVVSDEIHADFARPGYVHTPFASLDDRFLDASVICTSVSKTFNIAGLQTSTIVIKNEQLRERFCATSSRAGYSPANVLGIVAGEAAYREGGPWLEEFKNYIEGNIACVKEALKDTCLRLVEPQSTYLLWIDCRDLGVTDEELKQILKEKANVWVNMGREFGNGGEGFIRVNIACPRSVLADAMRRIAQAVS